MRPAIRQRSKSERLALSARIVELRKKDPELTAGVIAQRLGCNMSTVKTSLEAAGIYVPPKVGGGKVKRS